MEQQTVEAASTSEAVNFITYVQGLKRKMKSWEKQVNLYREGQRILERQRFQFPSSWLHVDNIDVIFNSFHILTVTIISAIIEQFFILTGRVERVQ
jgi:dynein heavy chain 1